MRIKIIFLIVAITISCETFSQSRTLEVEAHTSPASSNWCWANVTTIATHYYGNNTLECEIIEWVRQQQWLWDPREDVDDNCCSYPDSCFGGLYTSRVDEVLESEGLTNTYQYSAVSLSTAQATINDNRLIPIIGSRRDSNGNVTGLHSMLINGYNGSEIIYQDGANSYSIDYTEGTTTESMGRWYWRWDYMTHIITKEHCVSDLELSAEIDADASISVQNTIEISSVIGQNRAIDLKAGNEITIDAGFYIPTGSTLEVDVVSNPCN